MTELEVIRRLGWTDEEDWDRLDELVRTMSAHAWDAPLALARGWLARPGEQDKIRHVLGLLKELSIRPWFAIVPKAPADQKLFALEQAVGSLETLQSEIVQKLTRLLGSKVELPLASPLEETIEERELPSRECDEAYVLLRRILKPDESELTGELTRREFLRLEDEGKDEEIARYKTGAPWIQFVEDDLGE